MTDSAEVTEIDNVLQRIADLARSTGRTVATAESLTGGLLASQLSAAEEASVWFRGGIVAYHRDVKHTLLEVPDGPVVSSESALAMAHSTRRLLGADVACAVTGVGGPDRQDGRPVGTVYIAACSAQRDEVSEYHLGDETEEILTRTVEEALTLLTHAVADWPA